MLVGCGSLLHDAADRPSDVSSVSLMVQAPTTRVLSKPNRPGSVTSAQTYAFLGSSPPTGLAEIRASRASVRTLNTATAMICYDSRIALGSRRRTRCRRRIAVSRSSLWIGSPCVTCRSIKRGIGRNRRQCEPPAQKRNVPPLPSLGVRADEFADAGPAMGATSPPIPRPAHPSRVRSPTHPPHGGGTRGRQTHQGQARHLLPARQRGGLAGAFCLQAATD